MDPAHQSALNEIRSRANAAEKGDSANAWRHAALVVGTFPDSARALKQLRQHTGFTSSPAKKAAYERAAKILTEKTGVLSPDFTLAAA